MPEELDPRYHRQTLLPGIGAAGQQRLREASVLVIGVGGLGCPVATYLAAAGVGRLVLVDDDRVEAWNLHRQVLYGVADADRLKVDVAAERLARLNPDTCIEVHPVRLVASNARSFVRDSDVVADGSDNFATRYLISDACVHERRPCVHASVLRYEAHVTVLHHAGGPCYRCLYPSPPPAGVMPSCSEAGVLGSVVGVAGSMQATEVLKLLLGVGHPLSGRLLLFDAFAAATRTVAVSPDPACAACGVHSAAADVAGPRWSVTPAEARALLAHADAPLLLDVRSPAEHAAGNAGGRSVPLDELPSMLESLDPERPLLLYCHSGARAAQGAALLRAAGFTAFALEGRADALRQGSAFDSAPQSAGRPA